ncbi:MAG: SDR family NAD(P)-dependent oxidoreductase [Burkholderiales bacterium]
MVVAISMTLAGRTALITGAGGGIGSAVARAFAEAGADVTLADLKPVPTIANELRAVGRRVQKYGRIVSLGSMLGKNSGNARPWLDRSAHACFSPTNNRASSRRKYST